MVALSPLGLSGRCRRCRHKSAAHTAAVTATMPTTTPTMIQMRLSLLPLLTPVKCAEIRKSRVPGYIPANLFHVTSLFYSKTCSTSYWSNKATLCSTRYHLVKYHFIIFFLLLVLNCLYVSPQVIYCMQIPQHPKPTPNPEKSRCSVRPEEHTADVDTLKFVETLLNPERRLIRVQNAF